MDDGKKISLILLFAAALALLLLVLSVIALRWVNPFWTSFTLRSETPVTYELREYWVEPEEIPHHLIWSVIASEDQRFYEHWGLDFASIREVLDENQDGDGVRGASTITQQVAKNLFLWPARSWFRKTLEAGIALMIELFWTKERILEVYLNIAEFGPGIFGVGQAAESFFGITVSALEPEMSARLAVVLPAPSRMRVEPPGPFVQERSQWVLEQIYFLTGVNHLPYTPVRGSDSMQTGEPVEPITPEKEEQEQDGDETGDNE